ncbi:CKLF-like MARVEL transmembrane domain-containing protein 4 [Caerostris darwini]|uniref:CKLF-like MARVEL transmembrane domain-containing protein 4 n=1 Tax=Caerostris darwini TaxID=1538125 RepID=A0AAV4QTT5_9ARAC|nr:CKLF-like MARVEL transmembrane domain-containing protein 4 [Caerostris darwini]
MPGYVLDERDRGLWDMGNNSRTCERFTFNFMEDAFFCSNCPNFSSTTSVWLCVFHTSLFQTIVNAKCSKNLRFSLNELSLGYPTGFPVINNLIGMICIMVSRCSWCSNSNWFNFVASTGLVVTAVLLFFYLIHIVERLKFVPWLAIELLYCATWTLFYMIAALVVAVKGGRDDAWAAAGFFGFVGAILYASDCYTKYKSWRDGIPAQGCWRSGTSAAIPTFRRKLEGDNKKYRCWVHVTISCSYKVK